MTVCHFVNNCLKQKRESLITHLFNKIYWQLTMYPSWKKKNPNNIYLKEHPLLLPFWTVLSSQYHHHYSTEWVRYSKRLVTSSNSSSTIVSTSADHSTLQKNWPISFINSLSIFVNNKSKITTQVNHWTDLSPHSVWQRSSVTLWTKGKSRTKILRFCLNIWEK